MHTSNPIYISQTLSRLTLTQLYTQLHIIYTTTHITQLLCTCACAIGVCACVSVVTVVTENHYSYLTKSVIAKCFLGNLKPTLLPHKVVRM